MGNRKSKNTTNYTYNPAGELTNVGGVIYTYDANGNQKTRGSDNFDYDHENRLTQAAVSSISSTYTYHWSQAGAGN